MIEKDIKISFLDLSWAAFCFYYRSIADRKYCRIMGDLEFIEKLRQIPFEISPSEFEQKALLDYINIGSYDLLVGHKMAEVFLEKIIGLQPDISALQDFTLVDCDLTDNRITDRITRVYSLLSSIPGIWITGVSKIAHLLNDQLFVILNHDISKYFGLETTTGLLNWYEIMQNYAKQITKDFRECGFSGTPEGFISEKLGYTRYGCHKSLIKYLDEYFWLRLADNLPIPPAWIPAAQPLTVTRFTNSE